MQPLSHVLVGALKAVAEIDDSGVVLLGFELACDALRIQICDDEVEAHVAVSDGRQDPTDYVHHLVLFEVDLIHDHVGQVTFRVVF